jgi:succinate dehydrogenase/fumarate reductase cytochrome b subunit
VQRCFLKQTFWFEWIPIVCFVCPLFFSHAIAGVRHSVHLVSRMFHRRTRRSSTWRCLTQNCTPVTDNNENRTNNVPPSQRSRWSFFISIVVVLTLLTSQLWLMLLLARRSFSKIDPNTP